MHLPALRRLAKYSVAAVSTTRSAPAARIKIGVKIRRGYATSSKRRRKRKAALIQPIVGSPMESSGAASMIVAARAWRLESDVNRLPSKLADIYGVGLP